MRYIKDSKVKICRKCTTRDYKGRNSPVLNKKWYYNPLDGRSLLASEEEIPELIAKGYRPGRMYKRKARGYSHRWKKGKTSAEIKEDEALMMIESALNDLFGPPRLDVAITDLIRIITPDDEVLSDEQRLRKHVEEVFQACDFVNEINWLAELAKACKDEEYKSKIAEIIYSCQDRTKTIGEFLDFLKFSLKNYMLSS